MGYLEYSEDNETFKVDETGEIHKYATSKRITKKLVYGRDEPSYFRSYDQYESYLDDMPRSHYNLMKKILHYVAESANSEMKVHLDVGTKQQLMKMLGIQDLQSLNNTISLLNKGKCLLKIANGLYRVNPWLWGRGKWSDIQQLRDITPPLPENCTYGQAIGRIQQKKHKSDSIIRTPIIMIDEDQYAFYSNDLPIQEE